MTQVDAAIDRTAPNNAPQAITDQSITENAMKLQYDTIELKNTAADSDLPLLPGKIELLKDIRTCKKCGHTGLAGDFHKTAKITSVCKSCSNAAHKAALTKKIADSQQQDRFVLRLDFSGFPEVLETLTADARRNFRTLPNEILYRLVNFEPRILSTVVNQD